MDAKRIVLLSGGWDSAYCALKIPKPAHAVFVAYGQSFSAAEYKAARAVSERLGLPFEKVNLQFIAMDKRGTFKNRNDQLIAAALAKHSDATEIWFGTRNPTPLFDRHGDSNFIWGKLAGLRHGVKVKMPAVCLPKSVLVRRCVDAGITKDMIYSTEIENDNGN